ncbi:serine carboxypeptidase-like 45 isoform X2 [Populus alba]|uniref:serine carboxypeptidase-like 45 isoform X2 n=1 Tax=Populus alba TaxID=43335 RepID=UPI00158C9F5F|nr:serine carboxypeptidase-like 45 isoform X2 [Populus alba]
MGAHQWIAMAVLCATFFQICRAVHSSADDKLLSLPGQPRVSFQQYAGYVTVDENQDRALFYYFVEAEIDPASKPLVLWLNGGPGCSSVGAGAFSEHGPFRPSGGGSLVRNDYSWNKEANMLYLESPAGVGFSYSANQSFYDLVNDTITGHYVPQLADLIVKSGLKFNLKGIALGNPLLEFSTDLNSEGDFYWSHGLISNPTYELLSAVCNTSQLWRERIGNSLSASCSKVSDQLKAEIPNAIDLYDVTANVCLSFGASLLGVQNNPLTPRFRLFSSTESLREALSQQKAQENIDPCVQEETSVYLNRKDVQESFHTKLVGTPKWNICSGVVNYDLRNLEIPTIDVVGSLVNSGVRVLVYSGDQDSAIPFTGSRTLVEGLAKKLGLNATVPYTPWFEDKQVGGWTQVYGDILTFSTIRGGSHLAPFSSPGRSLALFAAFLSGKPLV